MSALVAPLYPRPSRVQRGFLGGVGGGAVKGDSSWAGPEPGPSPILSALGVVHAGICLCHFGIISDSWVWQPPHPPPTQPPGGVHGLGSLFPVQRRGLSDWSSSVPGDVDLGTGI